MTIEIARPRKANTHAFIHFKNEDDGNKYIRSANMLKKRTTRKKVKDNAIKGRRRKFPSEQNEVRQTLHSRETLQSSRFDNYELDTEARISQRPDCGENMPKGKPQEHQIPRHGNISRRSNGKMAIKKTHRNDCEQSREGTKTKRRRKDYE